MQKHHKFHSITHRSFVLAAALIAALGLVYAPAAQAAGKAPVAISGTVKQYYTNRAGYVSALTLQTSSGAKQVHFAPSWAKRLLDKNPVGSTLNGWAVPHQQGKWAWNNLVDIGKERPNRFLKDKFHTGTQKLNDRSWIWKHYSTQTVSGKLSKVIISDRGDVLALILDNGTLVRVPKTVRNEELGAAGTDAIAPLFKDVQVTAWGPRQWQARGDVSIYKKRIATTGISINGKPVSAIGIPRFPVKTDTFFHWNINPIGAHAVEVIGANGEYTPFGPGQAVAQAPQQHMQPAPASKREIGHAKLLTAKGKYFPTVHKGRRVFVIVNKKAQEMPLVKGSYVPPANLKTSKLVMVMPDGTQYNMSSQNGRLYVNLPDGNKSQVRL